MSSYPATVSIPNLFAFRSAIRVNLLTTAAATIAPIDTPAAEQFDVTVNGVSLKGEVSCVHPDPEAFNPMLLIGATVFISIWDNPDPAIDRSALPEEFDNENPMRITVTITKDCCLDNVGRSYVYDYKINESIVHMTY